MEAQELSSEMQIQRSSRSPEQVAARIADWLSREVGESVAVEVVGGVNSNGLSSDTLVLDASWAGGGERFVTRAAPTAEDVPVFPSYALGHQRDVIRLVGELTEVPVPQIPYADLEGSALGTPLFLMRHVEGVVPPDVLPYNFGDNWFADASLDEQRRLQEETVGVLAALHDIPDAEQVFAFLAEGQPGRAGSPEQHLQRVREWYEFAAADVGRSPLVERGLAWLAAHPPTVARPGEAVLCWGDARIGNVLFRDFRPVAVLDWEMAALGPREFDVAWLVFAHRVFESITEVLAMPGMPHVLREEDVVGAYAERTGVRLGDLTWFSVLAGVQWACVFLRTGARQIHFGEIERPEDIESLFHHKLLLERILDEAGAAR